VLVVLMLVSCPNTGRLNIQNTMALIIILSVLIEFSGYILKTIVVIFSVYPKLQNMYILR
jgi:hypothetical protein